MKHISRRYVAITVAISIMLVGVIGTVFVVTSHADPVNCTTTVSGTTAAAVQSAISSAAAGSTVCLNPATTYSGTVTLSSVSKASDVTIASSSGNGASIALDISDSGHLKFLNVTISVMDLDGASHDMTFKNSVFTGHVVIRTDQMLNANILFDGNTHDNISPPSTYEGRIEFPGQGSGPCGVTIQNSHFSGGAADGIQTGADGVKILNNEFTDIHQGDPAIAHTDSVQLYGSKDTEIKGNYFHDVEDGIMAPDGPDHEDIENNVFVTSGAQYAVTMGSDNSSVITHNTFTGTGGGIRVYEGNSGTLSTGTSFTNNVLTTGGTFTSTGGTEDYNLGMTGGVHDISGSPVFVGNPSPASYADYALTSGSPGHNAASDGKDMGIVIATVPPTSPPASSTPPLVTGSVPGGAATLSTTNGTWTGSPTSYTYQWQRCTAAIPNVCSNISGATSNSYIMALADLNDSLRVTVTATNTNGSTPINSVVGDYNGDGAVNSFDLGLFLSHWQATDSPAQDLNSDGSVNIFDLGLFLSHYET